MKFKPIYILSIMFYVLGLYLCLVWAKWLPRPSWIQEDIEPVYGILGSIGLLVAFVWQIIAPVSQSKNTGKNILIGGKLKTKKGIHIGDIGTKDKGQERDKKNVVKRSRIDTEEGFHLGDKNQ